MEGGSVQRVLRGQSFHVWGRRVRRGRVGMHRQGQQSSIWDHRWERLISIQDPKGWRDEGLAETTSTGSRCSNGRCGRGRKVITQICRLLPTKLVSCSSCCEV